MSQRAPVDLRKLRAKQLLNNEQFDEAKTLILEMINDGNNNDKLFEKLGDIYIELKQHRNGLKYYQMSADKNPNNPAIYMKIGNLFHQYLNDNNMAQIMYEKCIKMDPNNNELCWLNFGKMWFKQNNLLKAEQCYLKCKTPRAALNYYYSLLLLKKSSNIKQNKQKSLDLLLSATKLQPNVTKYRHQYALCLVDMEFIHEANESFEIALTLSNNKHIDVLYDYSLFITNYHRNYELALKYLKIGMSLVEYQKYDHIRQKYDDLYQYNYNYIESQQKKSKIQLVIYDFDETITYWNSYKKINGDINKLKYMKKADLIHCIFGSYDRLDRLHLHFQRILSSRNDMKIAILSLNHTNIITLALGRLGLLQYFSDIIGSDTSQSLESTKCKLPEIIYLAKQYELKLSTEVLFIDDNIKNIESTVNHCITYHVFTNYTLNGLSIQHMKEIEELLGVYEKDEFDIEPPMNKLSSSIKKINLSIYRAIKKQLGLPNKSMPIDELPVIQWIHTNWKDAHHIQHIEHFIYFAKMYKIVRRYRFKHNIWRIANILPKLVDMVIDSELSRRYAQCLAYLQHYDEAECRFKAAIRYSGHYLHRLEYGYFLFQRKRYSEAEEYFTLILNNQFKEISCPSRVYLGYARILAMLEQPCKAEVYYKLAIDIVATSGDWGDSHICHGLYAVFLYKQQRYKESKYQFEIALTENEKSVNNHYGLSKTLYKLGMFNEYEYHLKRTLELEPDFMNATIDLNRYHAQQRYQGNDCKEHISKVTSSINDKQVNNMINVYCIQFDRFWFDIIGIVNNTFNGYYDKFLCHNMNDIRCILFNDDIESDLRRKIGVNSLEDIQIIMRDIEYLRNEHKTFVECLKEAKLNEYYAIFAYNGMYTMHVMRQKIRCKKDIYDLIEYYNEETKHITNDFDTKSNMIINKLWDFVANN